MAVAGIVGARLLFLLEKQPESLLRPGELFGSQGFSFYGGMVFGIVAAAWWARRHGLGMSHLDALAAGFPLGMAVGRIGDLINGEHYGPPTALPWGIRYENAAAEVPSGAVAYHPGGLYEIVLALLLLGVVWLVRRHLHAPGALLWTVVGLYAGGRFVMFFYRVDSDDLALGLDSSQWVSIVLVAVAAAGLAVALRPRTMLRLRKLVWPLALLTLLLAAAGVTGCKGGDSAAGPVVEDPGPIHVHGLGSNPSDGALFIATHTGLFRLEEGERDARRVGDRFQDTMAFTVMGPDHFLGSGHPDGRDELPPFLGLIRSRDAGRGWREVSLQGEADFHLLEASGRRIYGYGSDFETREEQLLVSEDRGKAWRRLNAPAPLVSLAVDPADSSSAVASSSKALYSSEDGGRSWRRLDGRSGLLSWPDSRRLYLAGAGGAIQASADGGQRWQAIGRAGGAPSAFEAARSGALFLARHDGTIEQSTDSGLTWKVRSTP